MPGPIERDGTESQLLQFRHEQAEAPGAAAPAVHEEHDRPAPPAPAGELLAVVIDGECVTRFEEGFFVRAQWVLRRVGEQSLGESRGCSGGHRSQELEPEAKPDDPGIDSTQRIRPRSLVGGLLAHPATGPSSSTTATMTTTAMTSMTRPARSICRALTRPEP